MMIKTRYTPKFLCTCTRDGMGGFCYDHRSFVHCQFSGFPRVGTAKDKAHRHQRCSGKANKSTIRYIQKFDHEICLNYVLNAAEKYHGKFDLRHSQRVRSRHVL